jgi:hypothetical protein
MVRKEHFNEDVEETPGEAKAEVAQPEKRLRDCSDQELKALAYDCLIESQNANRNLALINEEISERQKKG